MKQMFSFKQDELKTILRYSAMLCGVNLLFFLLINQIDFVHFEMNDDFAAQSLLNGSMGAYYTHFPAMHISLSAAISGLYQALPMVNWYGVLLLVFLLFSASLVGGLLLNRFGWKLGLGLYLAVMPLLYGMLLLRFTYTMISYAMLTCSLICFYCWLTTEQRSTRRFLIVTALVLLVLAVLWRRDVWASAVVFYGGICLLWIILYKRKALRACIAAGIGFGAICVCFVGANAYYASTAELAEYKRFYEARIKLVDHAPLNYTEYPQEFAQVGWNECDAKLYAAHVFPDDARFSVENMERLYRLLEKTWYNTDGQGIARDLFAMLDAEQFYCLLLLMLAFCGSFFTQKGVWRRVFAVVLLALPFLFQIFFNVLWRSTFRAVYPHYLISIVLLVFFMDAAALHGALKGRGLTAAVCALCCMAALGLGNQILSAMRSGEQTMQSSTIYGNRDAFENMYLNSATTYVYPVNSPLLSANECYSIFQIFEPGYFANSRVMGGWDTRSPAYNDFKKKNNLHELPRDIIDHPRIQVVIPNVDLLTWYFETTYGIAVKYELVTPMGSEMFATKVLSATPEEKGLLVVPADEPQ